MKTMKGVANSTTLEGTSGILQLGDTKLKISKAMISVDELGILRILDTTRGVVVVTTQGGRFTLSQQKGVSLQDSVRSDFRFTMACDEPSENIAAFQSKIEVLARMVDAAFTGPVTPSIQFRVHVMTRKALAMYALVFTLLMVLGSSALLSIPASWHRGSPPPSTETTLPNPISDLPGVFPKNSISIARPTSSAIYVGWYTGRTALNVQSFEVRSGAGALLCSTRLSHCPISMVGKSFAQIRVIAIMADGKKVLSNLVTVP